METKYIVFFLTLIFGVPSSMLIVRSSERMRKVAVFLLVFSIPFIFSTGINFYTDMYYRGTARGYEILGVDVIAFTLLGSLLLLRDYKFEWCPPGTIFYWIYFFFSCLSIINAESVKYAGYEVLKMVMMYMFFVVLYNSVRHMRQLRVVLLALVVLLLLNLFFAVLQKYLWGVYQPSGLFPHRNATAMFANMMGPIFLSLLFNGQLKRGYFWLYFASFAASGILVLFALSRGALFFFPISCMIVAFGSLINKANFRKWRLFAILAILGIVAVGKWLPSLVDRFENAPKESAEGRVYLANAAFNMANDKVFGVGLNNWGIKINPPYPYSEGTGMVREEGYKSGLVETIYLLVAAECGWIGFFALLLWMGYYYFQALLNVRRYAKTPLFYLPLGLLAGLSAAYGQSMLEWILKQSISFYLLMTMFALIAVLTKEARLRKKRARP